MKTLMIFFLLFCNTVWAECDSYVIGFRGLGGQFDHAAFEQYAAQRASCSLVYNYTEIDAAIEWIHSADRPYELYGFSAGASSVAQIVPRVARKPDYVVTVGAWYTTDVDFGRYGIDFDNYFDDSGRQQQSPGTHVYGVAHYKMQAHVNQFYN